MAALKSAERGAATNGPGQTDPPPNNTLKRDEPWVDAVDTGWAVRLARPALILAVVAQTIYLTYIYLHADSGLLHATLPYVACVLAAPLIGMAITLTPTFMRHWRAVTLGLSFLVMAAWTCVNVLLGQQVQLLLAATVLLMGVGAMAPWSIAWQGALTAACVGFGLVGTILVRPASPYLGYLWLDLMTAAGLILTSNKLWARWYGAFTDANRRLKKSETKLRILLDANLDPVTIVRVSDSRYVYVNEQFLKRGYTRQEVLGKTVRELALWADERTDIDSFKEKLKALGFVRNEEINIRMGDGRIVPHLISSVLVDLDGERYVLSVGRDVTELKVAQSELMTTVAELRETQRRLQSEIERREQIIIEREATERLLEESEAKLRKVFDACPDVICINSLVDGRVIDINDAFLSTGFRREDALSWNPQSRSMFAHPEQLEELMRPLLKQGKVRNAEVEFVTANGTVVPCLLSAVAAEIRGEPCVISFVRDITRLKQTERQLIAASEASLAASRSKSEFLSSMSHEIRTPMNAILGMADLLAETPLTPEQSRYCETMISNGNALLDLINGILDLAKVESGRLHLEETEFELDELVERVAETLSVRAHEKGVELVTRIMPDVPLRLVGDPLRLRQVLINLVGNAIKFTERGEVLLSVQNDGAPAIGENGVEQRTLRFSVRDTGIGIPADKLEAIFQSFTQGDSSVTRRYGGSGLGLSIARRLVELMGGRVWAESVVAKGSTFHFTASFKASAAKAAAPELPSLASMPVLLVDDNATCRLVLRETLAALDAQVTEAAGGKEALAAVERDGGKYRVLLVDSDMPELDGFQLADSLRRNGDRTPIVMTLTSDNLNPKLTRLREMGLAGFLVKPVKRAELAQVVGVATGLVPPPAPKPAEPQGNGASIHRRPLRILLAEDSRDNRILIEAYLKNLPYELDIADNGEVALEKFMRRSYDIVLMDMQMPVMDGYTATRRIRRWENEQHRPDTPIIALTASALEEDVRNTLDAGCTAHLSKPVKKSRLLAVIHELVNPPAPDPADANGNGKKLSAPRRDAAQSAGS